MAEMYKITTGTGDYTIIAYQRSSPNRKKFIPIGELINTDGYRVDGKAVYNASYIVAEEWDENGSTVIRRVYGNPPKGAYIPARLLQSVYNENADNVALASQKYPGKNFTKAIHGLLNKRAAEVLGYSYLPNGWAQSGWKGEGLVKTYCRPVLPPERISAPIVIEYYGDNAEVFLDDDDPVADIRCYEAYVGSKSHGKDTVTIVRKSDGLGFDLGLSYWPKKYKKGYDNFSKVIDAVNRNSDCCGRYKALYSDEIIKILEG